MEKGGINQNDDHDRSEKPKDKPTKAPPSTKNLSPLASD
jgi:hypothetical protein